MSAYLASLVVLQENVRAEARVLRKTLLSTKAHEALERMLEQLSADVREVRADVGALMERNGEGW